MDEQKMTRTVKATYFRSRGSRPKMYMFGFSRWEGQRVSSENYFRGGNKVGCRMKVHWTSQYSNSAPWGYFRNILVISTCSSARYIQFIKHLYITQLSMFTHAKSVKGCTQLNNSISCAQNTFLKLDYYWLFELYCKSCTSCTKNTTYIWKITYKAFSSPAVAFCRHPQNLFSTLIICRVFL